METTTIKNQYCDEVAERSDCPYAKRVSFIPLLEFHNQNHFKGGTHIDMNWHCNLRFWGTWTLEKNFNCEDEDNMNICKITLDTK